MDSPVRFFDYWYFSLPNYLLAALMYSLLARFILVLVMRPDTTNYIYRFFRRVTDPIVSLFAFLTPRAVPGSVMILFAFVWLAMIRFAFYVAMANAGLAPTLGS